MALTNDTGISLLMAVYFASDNYDYNNDPNTISVTSLIKPVREVVLGMITKSKKDIDLSQLIASRTGSSVHDGLEMAWKNNYKNAMLKLGYSPEIIDRVKINPKTVNEGDIPVYLELRSSKKVGNWTISGKFDAVTDGQLSDLKNTSVFSYINKSNDEKHKLQGSIYRWLNQDIVTSNDLNIEYIFGDWNAKKAVAEKDKNYPPHKALTHKIPLMSIPQTDAYIRGRLTNIEHFIDNPAELPECTADELWIKASTFKYYKNPEKVGGRSTKNFDNIADANNRLAKDGGVGVVVEVKGEPTYCKYCSAQEACTQAERFILDGFLVL